MADYDDRPDEPVLKKFTVFDFSDRPLTPPTSGIYDGPLRYYAANKEWATILEGLIDILASPAAWDETVTDESHAAIQQILIFEEGINMPDLSSLAQDIRDGIYEAANDIAKQIVSGRTFNISVGDDGTVTDPTTGSGDAGLPEDDPDTIVNETKGARMGGSIEVAALCENVLERIDALYGATNGSPVYSASDAETVMGQFYDFEPSALNDAVTNYYSYRATNPRFLWVKTVTFPQYIYCNGATAQTVARYLIDIIGFTFAKQNAMLNFWYALTQAAYDAAFQHGISLPSSTYIDASCEPTPSETIVITSTTTDKFTLNTWKINHRLRFTVSGSIVDSNTPQRTVDLFWYIDNTGALVSRLGALTFVSGVTGLPKPTTAQIPYNTGHAYQFTVDMPVAGLIKINLASPTMTAPLTGAITITIDDLGEFTT